jgi:hypothetical protein
MFFQLKKLENMLKLYCFLFEENNKWKSFFLLLRVFFLFIIILREKILT